MKPGYSLVVALLFLPGAVFGQSIQDRAATGSLVDFRTSCSPAVTSEFNSAVEQLHSYEYPDSERLFRSVLESDPECGMARWGVAMSRWHSTWVPPSIADLDTGAAMLASIDRSKITAREAAYVDALSLFFTDYQTVPHQARAEAYRDRMAQVYADNLDDPEAAIFYALSLLATADPQDKSYANQFRSAGILNWVRNTNPRHPGVLHYIIHNYDYPGMAHLALGAATIYADVATNSTHAQHMPSHIFTRLGLWDRSISSNHDSHNSAVEYTQRANLDRHYDEGIHSIDYLMYAYLQTARDEEAGRLLTDLRTIGRGHLDNFKVAFTHASSPGRYALERRQWVEASRITLLPTDFPWQDFGWARSIHHFARGIGAARSDQLDLAKQELAAIREIEAALPATTLPYWREQVLVHRDVVSSWILLAEGDSATALRLAEAAADREDAVDKHPVTPGETLPARELFAEMLLIEGRPADALGQYRIVLAGSPNRANALLGAARAAAGSGETDVAAEYYQTVLEQTAAGDPNRDGLLEAREYIANLG